LKEQKQHHEGLRTIFVSDSLSQRTPIVARDTEGDSDDYQKCHDAPPDYNVYVYVYVYVYPQSG
jgi:hypothetical protein